MFSSGRRLTIRFTVVATFITATLLTASIALSLQYYFSRSMATETAATLFNNLADSTIEVIDRADVKAQQTASILSSYPSLVNEQWVNPEVRELFATLMHDSPTIYAINIGFENGDLYQVINLDSGTAVREQLNAASDDRWVIISIMGAEGQRKKTSDFFSDQFVLRDSIVEPSEYDASIRPWYLQAAEGRVTKSEPYLFHALQAPGQTYSIKSDGAVIGVDIALSSLSAYLASKNEAQFGELFLFKHNGNIIASNQPGKEDIKIPPVAPLVLSDTERELLNREGTIRVSNELDWAPIDFSIAGKPQGYSIDYLALIAQALDVEFEYINGYSWDQLVALFNLGGIDVLQPIFKNGEPDNGQPSRSGPYSDAFMELPYSLVTQNNVDAITRLSDLSGKTVAIPSGWSIIPIVENNFQDITVVVVKNTLEVFDAVRDGRAYAGLDIGEILYATGENYYFDDLRFHDNITFEPAQLPTELHFQIHNNHRYLLPLFNRAIAAISDSQKTALANKWLQGPDQIQGIMAVPYPQLVSIASDESAQRRLIDTKVKGEPFYLFVAPYGGSYDNSYGDSYDKSSAEYFGLAIPKNAVMATALEKVKSTVLITCLFLLALLPMPWIFSAPIVNPIKKLAIENEKIQLRQYDQLDIPSSYIHEINNLGQSMNVMVSAIRQHEAKQIALMDSFIQLIAQAIDDKSHYTAGHCERVPELALMLAQAAEQSTSGPFADFSFESEDEWREFKVAAWLHDCGKITTPEHIVDKGSKLETIYNRIHEIRTRFEILWRDAEISYWENLANNPNKEADLRQELNNTRKKLIDDFEFVATMNVGGEFLDESKKVRLREIAKRTWTRHFSDRLGLSPLEESRLKGSETELPCEESLLADKEEHVIPREHSTEYDPRLQIKMEVPKDLYNQGELYNLSIERGTLTAEDRFKINEHIISTIKMLDALPFPDELKRVPRYASTHHETLNGTGYPRQLSGKDLTIPERIMVLCDIFEALTASDRPYKKAKPLSVAIDILSKMVDNKHVDRDVFELFLNSGVLGKYSAEYLPKEQQDDVDISRYIHPTLSSA